MIRKLITVVTIAVAVVFVLSTSVFAAEFEGTVSAVDNKGMATIKATDGKEYKVSHCRGEGGRQGRLPCQGWQDVLPQAWQGAQIILRVRRVSPKTLAKHGVLLHAVLGACVSVFQTYLPGCTRAIWSQGSRLHVSCGVVPSLERREAGRVHIDQDAKEHTRCTA